MGINHSLDPRPPATEESALLVAIPGVCSTFRLRSLARRHRNLEAKG